MIRDQLHSRGAAQSKAGKGSAEILNQILLTLIVFICITLFGCKSSAANHTVEFIDRSAAFSQGISPKSLMLIVEIEEGGSLRLNRIETGTTHDMSLLAEKLEVVFADREKAGINEREVLIDPKIDVANDQYEELIRVLTDANASPIRVIKNDR